ncbi:tRNA (N(6)-L-threonylcarbamoyladenosine(37)-C(2))-methylthiotransferase MtaB [Christensenella tenuis]|uniref:tRNA (N(6)-L-threonylcarbamoyladenosine(37)-C(2))-methylthiotransferase MtaB n=1 Tax=Christensenella tenuis TaxID=2763033 RepID=A0ABR7EE28_9FIRM|nr:tRNA (N(6)-L-threonylcarbamoyladenosine(37)-C(2))-methylthiotransferase MtaB [Christensenella tenuis]MBC5647344.1 tRNA (N(6)-L-threonylcarbamoyladenosine(37)-C(2))-methylthiotransferase MtaB [Christensenella tenuis]
MKVAAYTLGCKVNQYDTNAMVELLEKSGFERVEFHEEADVYLINTCTVTNTADKKSRNMIRRLHKNHPEAVICVCGCLAQRDSEGILGIEGVSAVIGTEERSRIVQIVRECFDGKKVDGVCEIGKGFEELSVSSAGELTRGYIKIQEGCNNFCSYCIIPYVRGRVRSRASTGILSEGRALAARGVQEIVLTGIHISSYGQDNGESLLNVLDGLNGIEGIGRIRLGSLEPHILTREFLGEIKKLGKICPHFHVSLQSGSDAVLKRMNRKYTSMQFAEYMENIREAYDRPAIATDIITGFPGETEREFEETCRFAEEQAFSRIHVFPFSERAGTPAAEMGGKVPVDVRRSRANRLIEVGKQLECRFAGEFLGTVQAVLFEQETENGFAEGYTDRYLRIHAAGTPGGFQNVLLKKYNDAILYGDIIK